jgi:hypothetical protein
MSLGLYAISFYVFNLRFPEHSEKTLVFLEKFAFQLHNPLLESRAKRVHRACLDAMDTLTRRKGGMVVRRHAQHAVQYARQPSVSQCVLLSNLYAAQPLPTALLQQVALVCQNALLALAWRLLSQLLIVTCRFSRLHLLLMHAVHQAEDALRKHANCKILCFIS